MMVIDHGANSRSPAKFTGRPRYARGMLLIVTAGSDVALHRKLAARAAPPAVATGGKASSTVYWLERAPPCFSWLLKSDMVGILGSSFRAYNVGNVCENCQFIYGGIAPSC